MKHTSFKLIQAVNGGEIREGDNSLLVRKHADGTHQYLVSNDAGVWRPDGRGCGRGDAGP